MAIAGLAGMALSLAYLIVLASRGPQIAFAATCCLPGFLTASRKKKLLWSVIIVIGGALLFLFAGAINPRMLEKNTMRTFTERTVVWTHTQALARERPIMGYGYGKRIFKKTYYESNPPKSPFVYPHCHQYWLKLRFEFGWPGLALYFAVWTLLAVSLWRHIARLDSFDERLLPGAIGIILIFIHIYGLGDYPDNVVEIMLYSAAAAAVGVLAMPPEKQRSMAELPETHAQ